jgi:FHA domain-containing protein
MRRLAWLLLASLGIGVALVPATPRPAAAQIGWVKKALGMGDKKKKQPPPPAPAPAQPGTTAAPATPAPQPAVAAPAVQQPAGGVAPAPVVQQPGADAAAQTAQQKAERDSMMAEGRRLDAVVPQTLETAKYRLNYWEGLKLSGVMNSEVLQRNGKALEDVTAFQRADSIARANDASAKAVNAKMEQATRALQVKDLSAAEASVNEVLAADPTNQRAQLIREQIVRAQRANQFIKTLLILAAAAIAIAVVIAVLAKKVFKREPKPDAPASAAAAGSGRKVLIKVVDGIGRGKLLAVQGDIFRIGAAASDKPEEHNDLIISDGDATVSRYHCSIIRRGKDYYIVDSSLNGTSLNDKPLERGEHRKLRDGDDVTIADVARLKFLAT